MVGAEEGARLVEHLAREVRHHEGRGGVVPAGPAQVRHDEQRRVGVRAVDRLGEGGVGALGRAALVIEEREYALGRRGDELEAGAAVELKGGLPAEHWRQLRLGEVRVRV